MHVDFMLYLILVSSDKWQTEEMHTGWYAQSYVTRVQIAKALLSCTCSIPTHMLTLHTMQAKKDPTLRSLESRLRNARYLGELAKFRLAPFGTIFVMLKVCEAVTD